MPQVIPPPRRDWLRGASLLLALLGAADSLYLTWIKVTHARAAFCAPGGGCDVVNSSPYSEINGIPVAALGVGMFLALAGTLVLESRWPLAQTYGPLIVFGLSLTGALYSAYLTYLELAVIRAVCPYCVISALLITGILILAVARLFKTLPPEAATAR